MKKFKYFITIFLPSIFLFLSTKAQDNFSGNWIYEKNGNSIELKVGEPENQILYPCLINIRYNGLTGSYYTLLAKKDLLHVYISRNKIVKAASDDLIKWSPVLFTGKLHYERNALGKETLEFQHILNDVISNKKTTLEKPDQLFFNGTLAFARASKLAESDTGFNRIIQPGICNVYLGILPDTITTTLRSATLIYTENRDADLFSIKFNNRLIAEELNLKNKQEDQTVFLETGMNFICVFADDYGKKNGADGTIEIRNQENKSSLNFNSDLNKNSSFILQRILYINKEEDPWKLSKNKYGDIDWTKNFDVVQSEKKQKEEVVGEIISRSANLTFAIWDDAVEDGDSISLQVNGAWIANGFAVKNKVQNIQIHLKPGPNVITFIADNLGSISPNTSVLEIIDGNKRKSFHIETDTDKTNQVRIYYELN